jgi:hypothetical protein
MHALLIAMLKKWGWVHPAEQPRAMRVAGRANPRQPRGTMCTVAWSQVAGPQRMDARRCGVEDRGQHKGSAAAHDAPMAQRNPGGGMLSIWPTPICQHGRCVCCVWAGAVHQVHGCMQAARLLARGAGRGAQQVAGASPMRAQVAGPWHWSHQVGAPAESWAVWWVWGLCVCVLVWTASAYVRGMGLVLCGVWCTVSPSVSSFCRRRRRRRRGGPLPLGRPCPWSAGCSWHRLAASCWGALHPGTPRLLGTYYCDNNAATAALRRHLPALAHPAAAPTCVSFPPPLLTGEVGALGMRHCPYPVEAPLATGRPVGSALRGMLACPAATTGREPVLPDNSVRCRPCCAAWVSGGACAALGSMGVPLLPPLPPSLGAVVRTSAAQAPRQGGQGAALHQRRGVLGVARAGCGHSSRILCPCH